MKTICLPYAFLALSGGASLFKATWLDRETKGPWPAGQNGFTLKVEW